MKLLRYGPAGHEPGDVMTLGVEKLGEQRQVVGALAPPISPNKRHLASLTNQERLRRDFSN